MGPNQWLVASLLLGFFSASLPAEPSLAIGKPTIVQLSSTKDGLLAKSPSQRLVDKAHEKEKKGDRQGALRDLEEALQADPRNFWAYMSRGVIWLQMESYQRAIADATQAIALNPRNPDNWSPYNLRAMAHLLLKEYEAAAQDWEKARQFNLPRELLHVNLYSRGDALRLAGDLPGAIAECTKSIQLLPTAEAYDNRGMAYSQKGDKDLALADFRAAARGFGSKQDFANLDTVILRLLGLQAAMAGVGIYAPRSWQFPAVIESARTLSPRNLEGRTFDQSGLAYPLEQLDSLPVASLPDSELQKYADIVTHAFPDAAFLRQVSVKGCGDILAEELNTTALANMAYISLQAKFLPNRAEAASCLKEFQDVWRQRRDR
jgi:tetratricopeptide (TPR) repeat protein